jgi:hypothetical protein
MGGNHLAGLAPLSVANERMHLRVYPQLCASNLIGNLKTIPEVCPPPFSVFHYKAAYSEDFI